MEVRATQVAPLLTLCATLAAQADPGGGIRDVAQDPDRTVRAGEGLRASALGFDFEIQPRDRRSVSAWDVGVAHAADADGLETIPFASAYFWRRPDEDRFLRAVVAGVYNDVTWAESPDGWGAGEWLLTLDTWTLPRASRELVDGEADDAQELKWGYVRPGVGIGVRESVGPHCDNQFVASLVGEFGVLYFGRGDRASATFDTPDSVPEARLRSVVRYDQLERNLLEMPHEGHALGADLVGGHRIGWDEWGLPQDPRGDGEATYGIASAYGFAIAPVPFVDADRHRLLASAHVAIADGVDRFSAPRLGGGPDPRGEEFGLVARPILPGAALGEFTPERYATLHAGYRLQFTWFAFLDLGGTAAWLDRDHRESNGSITRTDDFVTACTARVSSGCFGRTRFQLLYAHNFDVVRNGNEGADEVSFHVTGYF